MIQKQVVHRAKVKTVYSSEKQQRMKVYFELTEQYKKCLEPCKLQPYEVKEQCEKQCEKIYEKYVDILKPRYQNNKQRLDMEVKNAPIFKERRRKDRSGTFFEIFDMSWRQFLGIETNQKV